MYICAVWVLPIDAWHGTSPPFFMRVWLCETKLSQAIPVPRGGQTGWLLLIEVFNCTFQLHNCPQVWHPAAPWCPKALTSTPQQEEGLMVTLLKSRSPLHKLGAFIRPSCNCCSLIPYICDQIQHIRFDKPNSTDLIGWGHVTKFNTSDLISQIQHIWLYGVMWPSPSSLQIFLWGLFVSAAWYAVEQHCTLVNVFFSFQV